MTTVEPHGFPYFVLFCCFPVSLGATTPRQKNFDFKICLGSFGNMFGRLLGGLGDILGKLWGHSWKNFGAILASY